MKAEPIITTPSDCIVGYVVRDPPNLVELERLWQATGVEPYAPCFKRRARGCCQTGEPSCTWGRWQQAADYAEPDVRAAFNSLKAEGQPRG